MAVRSLADWIRRKWEESAVKPTTLASYSKTPAQESLEKMLHLRVAVNQKRFGKGPLFGRVPPYGKSHQHDVASPLRTKGPHWCAMEKGGPNIPGASNHLGHWRVTALSSRAGCPVAMNWYGGDLICHQRVPLTLLAGTLSPRPGYPAPVRAPNNAPGLSPAGACWASSLFGISHFLGQSLYKQREKARAELNTQIAEDTLRNCRGEKYAALSACRGGAFTRPQRQCWNRSCVLNKSSALLPGRPARAGV